VLSLRHFRLARWCSLSLGGWWAEESGAAHFGFGGAMLLDLLGPPGLAGGAVADFVLVIFRFGATMELGRSERTTMRPLLRPLWSYRVDGADSPDRKPR
jgi:hypothetical protein